MTYPSGRVVAYSRDAIGRISDVTMGYQGGAALPIVSNRTYRADGRLTSLTLGNGLLEDRQNCFFTSWH